MSVTITANGSFSQEALDAYPGWCRRRSAIRWQAGMQTAARESLGCGCGSCCEALRIFGIDDGDGRAHGCRR